MEYGTGGHISYKQHICLLAPNALSEKIFVFLWFWLVFLMIIVIANLILIIFLAFKSKTIRRWYLKKAVESSKLSNKIFNDKDGLNKELKKLHFGQILFLYFLGRNVDFSIFMDILQEICNCNTKTAYSLTEEMSVTDDLSRSTTYGETEGK